MSELELYYHPASYYSQRVLMAFAEKNLEFKPQLIDLMNLDNHRAWYLQNINSVGQVPALKKGDLVIADSEKIIKYIDREYEPSVFCLGKETQGLVDLVNKANVKILTFGVCIFEDLAKDLKIPPDFRAVTKEKMETRIFGDVLKEEYKKYPELSELFEDKIKNIEKVNEEMLNKTVVKETIDEATEILLKLDTHLKKQGFPDCPEEQWLVGKSFTIADIFLAILLARFTMIGLSYLWEDGNMAAIAKYHEMVRQRESYKKCAKEA